MTANAFTGLSAHDLLHRFADGSPTPGGGSASALAGALAASLAQMVAGLTVGKKNYEAVSDEAAALKARALAIASQLEAGIAEDSQAFESVMAAMGLPKETDEQKAARRDAMQDAFKGATEVPLKAAAACVEAGRVALKLLEIGNKNAVTDAGVAVLLAVSGAEGALFNAEINLGSIKDGAWVEAQRNLMTPLWLEARRLREALWPAMRESGLHIPA
jgi:formiminotetrahydrofolate cyclodeaminase